MEVKEWGFYPCYSPDCSTTTILPTHESRPGPCRTREAFTGSKNTNDSNNIRRFATFASCSVVSERSFGRKDPDLTLSLQVPSLRCTG